MNGLRPACSERFLIITRSLYAFPLPDPLKPGYWVSPPSPAVHGFPMSSQQVRTDDYQRTAEVFRLECKLRAPTEQALIEMTERYGMIVRDAFYLQRAGWGLLQLLEGSEVDLKPDGNKSNEGIFGVTLAAQNRKWLRPDGSVILGER